MGKYFYYCHNERCRRLVLGKNFRTPIGEVGQELDGKKLCLDCYDFGFRLKKGVVVVRASTSKGGK